MDHLLSVECKENVHMWSCQWLASATTLTTAAWPHTQARWDTHLLPLGRLGGGTRILFETWTYLLDSS